MNLYSDNLILRPFELNDAERVRELAGDYEIAKTTLNIPHPYPEGGAEEFIKRSHEVAKEGSHYAFAIVRKLDDELVGTIALGIVPSINEQKWHIGWGNHTGGKVIQRKRRVDC